MYTHILTKYISRKIFMKKSFIFNIQNKIFRDRVIYLVQLKKFLQRMFHFTFLLNESKTY